MNNQDPKMFDSKMILAIVAAIGFFIFWQNFLAKKYPDAFKTKTNTAATTSASDGSMTTSTGATAQAPAQKDGATPDTKSSDLNILVQARDLGEAQILNYDSPQASFQISSHGFAVNNYKIKSYKDEKDRSELMDLAKNISKEVQL